MEFSSTNKSLLRSPVYIAVILVLLVISFVAGGLVNQKLLSPGKDKELNQLFTTEDATIRGQITKVDGSTLTIKNKAGAVSTLRIVPGSPIYKANQTKGSIDLDSIELNKDVMILARKFNNEYQVFLIKYYPFYRKEPSSTDSSTLKQE